MEAMSRSSDLEYEIHNYLSSLERRKFLENEWDIAAFAIILTFVGTVLLLLLMVLIHCCCNCDAPRKSKISRRKVGIDNLAMEPFPSRGWRE
ncbi:small integral membrane protein 22 [Calypte anna]|uniref:small integral membrane protein 22 n=1 Tax=Calypte anna TaxID=9244 RepID=UPI0011C49ABD|nr:small integral membrane protein 22 [Calypte anna]XP_030315680.1 small integral membrane protein 22 [Calypte anna]XP_030315681.1 small integral membrane protein 22 [Calypte anna]XP_030315682.1 small integral membrane protein 22 [Calypte anna]